MEMTFANLVAGQFFRITDGRATHVENETLLRTATSANQGLVVSEGNDKFYYRNVQWDWTVELADAIF